MMEVEIRIDGQVLELNEFVQQILGNAIAGAVSALKGARKDWDTLNVVVKRIK